MCCRALGSLNKSLLAVEEKLGKSKTEKRKRALQAQRDRLVGVRDQLLVGTPQSNDSFQSYACDEYLPPPLPQFFLPTVLSNPLVPVMPMFLSPCFSR